MKGVAVANLKDLYRELWVGREVVILECVMKQDQNPAAFHYATGKSWRARVVSVGDYGRFECELISQSRFKI